MIRTQQCPDDLRNRFAPAKREALFDAVLTHDTVHLDATMPRHFPVPSSERLEAAYWLSHEMWRDGFSKRRLADIAERAALSGRLASADLESVKHMRARCKQLRFLFVLADARHGKPRHLDRLTRTMGTLQDATKHGRVVKAARTAGFLRCLLTPVPQWRLEKECLGFRPTSPEAFASLMERECTKLRENLGRAEVRICDFHESRKVISRLVALYDTERIMAPSPAAEATGRFLNTLNGLMGSLHDDLVARKMVCRTDYRSGSMVMPPPIVSRLRDLTRTMARCVPPREVPMSASTGALALG
jgi:hypothetical protein